jgi:signal transduction histidine kinase
MTSGMRPFFKGFGVATSSGLILLAALFIFWPDVYRTLLSTNGFDPHGGCFRWDVPLLWLHGSSDFLIGAAYVSISTTLAYLVYRVRRDIPFTWIILAFGVFIVACGGTHFMEVITLWFATYWLSGSLKVVTAVASVATALALPPLIPKTQVLVKEAKISQERKARLELANQELAELNEKLKELDQLKTEFFANVSHELRTPLTLILGPTHNLLETEDLTEVQRYNLEVIERNARNLLHQVNDLLDVARLDAGRLEPNYTESDLASLVRVTASYFEVLVKERQINFKIETPSQLPTPLDLDKTQRVLVNLLSNAFKFTPAGGTIRYSLRVEAEHAVITVADSGPGIKPEQRTLIFERFRQVEGGTTRRYGGTGLGLAIAKEFVELQGGSITVEDAPEGGALFRVTMPLKTANTEELTPAQLESSATAEETARQTLEEIRPVEPLPQTQAENIQSDEITNDVPVEELRPLVLVVEDNVEMQRFIAASLSNQYRIATANNGREGLEKATSLKPDLILSDIMMPEMSGDQLVKEIRLRRGLNDTPVVLLSAKTEDRLRVELLQNGAQDYLVKPFSTQELRVRLANLITIKRTRQVLQRELTSQQQNITDLAWELATRSQELQKALTARDEFLSVAAHELKTPITSLRGFSQLILNQFDKGKTPDLARIEQALRTIDRQSEKLAYLVSQLLDVSRLQAGRMLLEKQPTDLVKLVEGVVANAQIRTTNHALTLRTPPELVTLVDPVRFEQVVTNLVDNAIKYSPEGGPVDLELSTSDKIRLCVTDRGVGVPTENQPHIFERFYQVRTHAYYGGMGLGLYISRQIVEMHGGQIEVQNPVEGGSRFIISLPLETDQEQGE